MLAQPGKFFNTQSDDSASKLPQQIIKRKTQLGSYVSKLDYHINKNMNFQNRTLNRKKNNLLQTLQNMKDQIYKQSERARKMEQFFYEHCQKILINDISKWDGNKDFFNQMFLFYDMKIKEKTNYINLKKSQVEVKKKQLKQILKDSRKAITVQQLSQRINSQIKFKLSTKIKLHSESQDTNANTINNTQRQMMRVKTETSLPNLSRNNRLKTTIDDNSDGKANYRQDSVKNYMKPIKTQKSQMNPQSTRQSLLQMLNWYKNDKQEYNWFDKVVFLDRNFKKIVQSITKA